MVSRRSDVFNELFSNPTESYFALSHICRVQLRQDLNFLLDVLDLIFSTLKIDYLDRYRLLGSFVVARFNNRFGVL